MRRAFTLVELLVAAGIIAVLAGIAVPVYQQVRRQARTAMCTSHLQQLGLAIRAYQQESRLGRLPGFLRLDPAGLRRGLGDPGQSLADAARDLWRCPFDPSRGGEARLNRPAAWDSGSEDLSYLHENGSSYLYEASANPLRMDSLSWFFPAASTCTLGAGEWADGKAHQLRHQQIAGQSIPSGRMPLVRCFYHHPWSPTGTATSIASAWTCIPGSSGSSTGYANPAKVLNLAWDGSVFWSMPWWEAGLR